MNRQITIAKLTFGLLEGVLTLVGFIAVITPLILWAVPQVGDFSITVYYYVVSIGVGAFVAVVGLTFLQHRLFPDSAPDGEFRDFQTLRQLRLDWEEAQEEKLRAGKGRQLVKGYARRDIGYMAGIAGLLAMGFVVVFLPAGAIIELGAVAGTNHRILVVEDSDEERAMMHRLLLRSGYKVVEARTGREGLEMLETDGNISLVLTDVTLGGGMKGPEMMRQAWRKTPKLKAIFTGYTYEEWEIREAFGEEAVILPKPFLIAEFRAHVRAALASIE
ncbi:MAG: response regulator [Rhodospirillaceae bacterium]|nr:response regulator [Rhodospirillaceae bacterium]MBT4686493.1 response regulator [Rhodospirillaceae bacterium]MBT5083824.1 response regulator [Rhodospirillaceae bacterium]MBT5526261.1 response regulator [Rhodospirillaceae bacterium]MBT5882391.1 response regulator [Rhodospirillaceae bacterium]